MLLRRRGGRNICHDHALDRRRAEQPRRSHGGEALERVDGDDRRAGREQAAERAARRRARAVAPGEELTRKPIEVLRRLDRVAAGAAEVAVVQERYSIRGAAVGEACREAAVAGAEDDDAAPRLVQVQRCGDSRPAFSIVVLGPSLLAHECAHGCNRGLPGCQLGCHHLYLFMLHP